MNTGASESVDWGKKLSSKFPPLWAGSKSIKEIKDFKLNILSNFDTVMFLQVRDERKSSFIICGEFDQFAHCLMFLISESITISPKHVLLQKLGDKDIKVFINFDRKKQEPLSRIKRYFPHPLTVEVFNFTQECEHLLSQLNDEEASSIPKQPTFDKFAINCARLSPQCYRYFTDFRYLFVYLQSKLEQGNVWSEEASVIDEGKRAGKLLISQTKKKVKTEGRYRSNEDSAEEGDDTNDVEEVEDEENFEDVDDQGNIKDLIDYNTKSNRNDDILIRTHSRLLFEAQRLKIDPIAHVEDNMTPRDLRRLQELEKFNKKPKHKKIREDKGEEQKTAERTLTSSVNDKRTYLQEIGIEKTQMELSEEQFQYQKLKEDYDTETKELACINMELEEIQSTLNKKKQDFKDKEQDFLESPDKMIEFSLTQRDLKLREKELVDRRVQLESVLCESEKKLKNLYSCVKKQSSEKLADSVNPLLSLSSIN